MATGLRWKGKKSLTEQKAPARMSGGSRKAGIYASALVGCPENAGSIPAARFSPCGETGITLRDHEGNAGQKVQIRVYGPPDSSCELNIAGSSPARGIFQKGYDKQTFALIVKSIVAVKKSVKQFLSCPFWLMASGLLLGGTTSTIGHPTSSVRFKDATPLTVPPHTFDSI